MTADVPTGLALAAAGAGWLGYEYLPAALVKGFEFLDRAAGRGVRRIVDDAVTVGVIPPAPAAVECPSCDGRGVVENDATDSLWAPMWATCPTCEGLGSVESAPVAGGASS